jgi:hypothetical protein
MEYSDQPSVTPSGVGGIAVGGSVTDSVFVTNVFQNTPFASASSVITPPQLARISFLPLGDKFTGRKELLDILTRELIAGSASAVSQLRAVHADGGVGQDSPCRRIGLDSINRVDSITSFSLTPHHPSRSAIRWPIFMIRAYPAKLPPCQPTLPPPGGRHSAGPGTTYSPGAAGVGLHLNREISRFWCFRRNPVSS